MKEKYSLICNFEGGEKAHALKLTSFFFGSSHALKFEVDELEITPRLRNCLKKNNLNTIGDIVKKDHASIMDIPNFGKKCFRELRELLDCMGLTLYYEDR